MSGIAVIFHTNGQAADKEVMECMLLRLAHRGKDGRGIWSSGAVALGQVVHWTTPESTQIGPPVRAQQSNLVLVADVRIDNRADLLGALYAPGNRQIIISDEELVLKAYQRWGEACPERLVGDFCFAIWDGRNRTLFCARDHMGVKPLYYSSGSRLFLCASEIKALFCHARTPRRLNEVRVADYLAMNFEDKVITFYRDIYRLPPGHSVSVGPKGLRIRCYWSLDASSDIRLKSDSEYAESFRDIFTQAVRYRLRSHRPLGFLLSGGLDSSSIVCVARQLAKNRGGAPLIAFSASFPDFPQLNEQAFIDEVVASGGIEVNSVCADQVGPLHDFERVFLHQDEPFHAPNLFVYWVLAAAAVERGVDILVDGVDGDTIVSHGLEFLVELFWSARVWRLASEIRWLARRTGHARRRIAWHQAIRPSLIEPLLLRWKWLSSGVGKGLSDAPLTVNRAFARRVGWSERYRALLGKRAWPSCSLKETHWRQITSGIIPFYLEVNDKAAAAFGLDHRHPFFDRRLVEFCYGLPSEQKLKAGWDRVVQRRAMDGILPKRIQWRIWKAHWGLNFERGLMQFHRTLLEDFLADGAAPVWEYVDRLALLAAYKRCRANGLTERDGMSLWVAVTLGLWLQRMGI